MAYKNALDGYCSFLNQAGIRTDSFVLLADSCYRGRPVPTAGLPFRNERSGSEFRHIQIQNRGFHEQYTFSSFQQIHWGLTFLSELCRLSVRVRKVPDRGAYQLQGQQTGAEYGRLRHLPHHRIREGRYSFFLYLPFLFFPVFFICEPREMLSYDIGIAGGNNLYTYQKNTGLFL